MRNERVRPIEKIARVSAILEFLFCIALVVLVAAVIYLLGLMATSPNSSEASFFADRTELNELNFSDDDIKQGRLTVADKMLVSVFLAGILGSAAFCFGYLAMLMHRFKGHQVFGEKSVFLAKAAAYSYLLGVVVLTVGVVSMGLVNGDLQLNGRLLQSFLSAGLLWLFVWIIQIGTALQNENELTV